MAFVWFPYAFSSFVFSIIVENITRHCQHVFTRPAGKTTWIFPCPIVQLIFFFSQKRYEFHSSIYSLLIEVKEKEGKKREIAKRDRERTEVKKGPGCHFKRNEKIIYILFIHNISCKRGCFFIPFRSFHWRRPTSLTVEKFDAC